MISSQSSYTIAELAALTGAAFSGDGQKRISGIGTIQDADSSQATFLANPLYRKYLGTTQAGVVVVTQEDAQQIKSSNLLISGNPYATYAKIAQLFFPTHSPTKQQIHPTAVISPSALIAEHVIIGPHAVIGEHVSIADDVVIGANVVIGDRCRIDSGTLIHSQVTLYSDVSLGKRVVLHSGVVLGADGFGFANDKGVWIKIPQIGGVEVRDDVEIGANTTIDRGALGNTLIEENVKIDNLVQIGHNASIGAHTVIAGCVGISGSARIGRYCMIGGGAGVAGHITVCDKVVVTGMTMLTRSIDVAGIYSSGTGLDENTAWKKNVARFRNLDSLARRVIKLQKQLNEWINK